MNEIERPVEMLGLSPHACQLLKLAGYKKAIEVAEATDSIRHLPGIGPRTYAQILLALRYHGYKVEVPDLQRSLSLKSKYEKYPYPVNLALAVMGAEDSTEVWDCGKPPKDLLPAAEYAVSKLPPRNQSVLYARFKTCKTLKETGIEIGLSPERVRQIEAKSLRVLRHPMQRGLFVYGLDEYIKTRCSSAVMQAELAKDQEIGRLQAIIAELEQKDERKAAMAENDLLRETPLEELDLSVRSYNALKRAGYDRAIDVAMEDPDKIFRLRNVGRKSYNEIMFRLKEHGYNVTEKF